MARFLPDRLILLSAALIVFAFPPWNFSFLIWLALVPWLLTMDRSPSLAHSIKQGLWLSFFMTLGGFFWVAWVLQQFGGLPWPLGVAGLLLFGLICQPQFPLSGALLYFVFKYSKDGRRGGRRGFYCALLSASLYTGVDWIIPKLFADTLGHSLYEANRLRQVADIGGAPLLTFLVFLVNYALWQLFDHLRKRKEPSWWPSLSANTPTLLASLLLATAFWGYGLVREKNIRRLIENSPQSLQAAVIQGNIGDFDKIAAEKGIRGAAQKIMETYFELSDHALSMTPKPDVLVWPETSYPSTFRSPQTSDELQRDQSVERYVKERGTPLLFGGYDRAARKDFNSFFFLTPRALLNSSEPLNRVATDFPVETDLQVYHKNILLLFGEYIPGAEQIPFIKQTFPQVGNFGRGPGPEVLRIHTRNATARTVLAGPIICYEALFPSYILGAARKGSQMILNITNDSWFGTFGEPQLHLALTTFRSIEARLPQLRSTNTGVSALILPDGSIAHRTNIGTPEVMSVRVPLITPVWTLMKAWGDWFGPFALFAGMVGLTVFLKTARKTE